MWNISQFGILPSNVKSLHHSMSTELITQDINEIEFLVRNVTNIRKKKHNNFFEKLPSNIHSDLTNLYDLSSEYTPTMLKLELNFPPHQSESFTPSQLNWSTFKKVINKDIKPSILLKTSDDIKNVKDVDKKDVIKKSPHNLYPKSCTRIGKIL
jgi:hypothetical protein